MRKPLVLVLFVAVLMIPPTAGAGPCEPEDPYLYCGYECSSNSCVHGSFTPETSYCVLMFPGCSQGSNHQCCQMGGGF